MSVIAPVTTPVEGTEMLEPELQGLAHQVREFADEVVAPAAYEYDTQRRLPIEIIRQMGEMGLFGLPLPLEYGGQGKTYLHLCVAVEQLARVDQSIAVTLEAGLGLGAMPIFRFGTPEQEETYLPSLARGEALAAFGLTEAEAGLGRRWNEDDRDARGRLVADRRHEAVHHEFRDADHQRRDGHCRHG